MKIEKYLVLNKYLLSLFGVAEVRDLQKELAEKPVGYDSDGRSYFVNVLRSLDGLQRGKLSEEILLHYDGNIRGYVARINTRREPKIILKYFQYLAVLFADIYLDELKNRKIGLLSDLNTFLDSYCRENDLGDRIGHFTEDDLRKLAFWMATGSGKTLLLHINYYQFLRYKLFSPDNIILITPNEGLSRQHAEELQKSGIMCRLYGGNLSNVGAPPGEQGVLILEMTKLVEEKKGGGVTLPVDVFEGQNLVFVDEGHKGKKSEEQKWAKLRNRIAENGFVFEYSATFGQILNESNRETLVEYAKAIVFDYSYKYFYLDGYGKDFSVLNVKPGNLNQQQFQETMFVANLLAFYQQYLAYEDNRLLAQEHNLEKPLWIFVGTTVNEEESDVLQIIKLFQRVLHDEGWVRKQAKIILDGHSGLKNEDDEDALADEFDYIRQMGFDLDDLYRRVFGGKGRFGVHEIRNADGELALKVGENQYFGVVNIGIVLNVKKELEKKGIGIEVDAVSGSLFDSIKRETSPINVLIGSKKFIEGWDTWRVSSMGLLNIGTGQGPQIIQLFGRGIRIKGRGYSLKRSGDKGPVHFLETLNIYGIKADYLSRFLEAIKKEEVEFESIDIPVKVQHEKKWGQLYYLTKDQTKKFEEEIVLPLEIDKRLFVSLDLTPKVMMFIGKDREKDGGVKIQQVQAEKTKGSLPENIFGLLNWPRILAELQEFKASRGYWNLVISKDRLKNILLSGRYEILVLGEYLHVKTKEDLNRTEDIAIQILKKYMEQFYKHHAKRYESKNMRYDMVTRQTVLPLFVKEGNQYAYTVQINKEEKKLIEEVKKLVKDLGKLFKQAEKPLPRVYFDRHLYLPILLRSKKIDKISPAGLEDSEKEFITHFKQYLENNKDKLGAYEIYLLRNFPKVGVGFFNLSGFYPDFIMWVKNGKRQQIVFLDPKGLEHIKRLDHEKIQLAKGIKSLESDLGKVNISLHSFILSKTPYDNLIKGIEEPESREEYEANHVLFLDDQEWPKKFFRDILK